MGNIKEIAAFFNASAKRQFVLKNILKHNLKGLCETRWVERHDSVLQFKVDLKKIVEALDKINMWKESGSSRKAYSYKQAILNCEFVITLYCLSEVLSITQPLSVMLQTKNLDKTQASTMFISTLKVLKEKRSLSEINFNKLWADIEGQLNDLDIQPTLPRLPKKATHRENHPVNSAECYWRVTIYIPLLDNVVSDLESRFSKDILDIYDLNIFLPSVIIRSSDSVIDEKMSSLAKKYFKVFEVEEKILLDSILGETRIWKEHWKIQFNDKKKVPDNLVETLSDCDIIFPNIKTFLMILGCLPISNATPERSFSSLRRIKSYLRTNMTQERLSGLALLNMHRNIEVNPETVIDIFAQKNRKISFIL